MHTYTSDWVPYFFLKSFLRPKPTLKSALNLLKQNRTSRTPILTLSCQRVDKLIEHLVSKRDELQTDVRAMILMHKILKLQQPP